jgi:hypothetical protein
MSCVELLGGSDCLRGFASEASLSVPVQGKDFRIKLATAITEQTYFADSG